MVKMTKKNPVDKYAQWVGLNPATQTVADEDKFVRTILPVNAREGLVMLIYAVELFCGVPPDIDAAYVQATLSSIDQRVYVQDPEHVATRELEYIGAAGQGTAFCVQGSLDALMTYPEPFIYPLGHIWLSIQTHLTGTTNNAQARILYKLVKISTEELLQAIAAWQG